MNEHPGGNAPCSGCGVEPDEVGEMHHFFGCSVAYPTGEYHPQCVHGPECSGTGPDCAPADCGCGMGDKCQNDDYLRAPWLDVQFGSRGGPDE